MLVRPVSYGFNYKVEGEAFGKEAVLRVKSDEVVRVEIDFEGERMEADIWAYRDGDTMLLTMKIKEFYAYGDATEEELKKMNESVAVSEKVYEEEIVKDIEEMKKNKPEMYKEYLEAAGMKLGIYEIELGDEVAKCTQAIVFTVVHGVVTVALLTFAVLAIVFVAKKKA
jgi:hypothetical protein